MFPEFVFPVLEFLWSDSASPIQLIQLFVSREAFVNPNHVDIIYMHNDGFQTPDLEISALDRYRVEQHPKIISARIIFETSVTCARKGYRYIQVVSLV
jgi:hypothetical protein